ncbi:MAG: GntR family transcriptional regulator [Chitinivibrionales bacterium]|nr:GntR family transcriptional regulator [Chitinivibrionales bacterium]
MRKAPSFEKALYFVEKLIEKSKEVSNPRLPKTSEMAERAGVSLRTMWKAVNAFKKRNILQCNTGEGIFISELLGSGGGDGLFSGDEQFFPGRATGWQKVKGRLERDILVGRFSHGEKLPSYKELRTLYDVSFVTLKKALAQLESEGLVRPCKRGYAVAGAERQAAALSIVLIQPGFKRGKFLLNKSFDMDFMRYLEFACSKNNVFLKLIAVSTDPMPPHLVDMAANTTVELSDIDTEDIAGYIYSAKELDYDAGFILSGCASLKKPFALLDFTGELELSKSVQSMSLTHLFRMSTLEKPAHAIARYCIGLGHKKIAYISPIHESKWSRVRLAALRSVFSAAGYADGVAEFTRKSLPTKTAEKKVLELQEKDLYPIQASEEWWKRLDYAYREQMYFPIRRMGWVTLKSAIIFENCIPLFKNALRDKNITAWICANDLIASMALSYLRTKNIKVPQDISIIGFDDTLDAMGERITSYNFNLQSIAEAMINFILHPYGFKRVWKRKITDIEGSLVVRSTSDKARSTSL